ncbi:MAG: insulinase family protein [Candidatus Eisenbacteria bacterium]|nr:insulinase family protein [Candidatus Eisenbacteria bacterium]
MNRTPSRGAPRARLLPPAIGVAVAVAVELLGLLAPSAGLAAGFADLEESVQKYVLPNGLTFLVVERHNAPVFSFRTFVDAGGADEVPGISGIAHMFEHMAFKGTPTVGVTDAVKEAEALDAVDAAWDAVMAEREKGFACDSTLLRAAEDRFRSAKEHARSFVISNDFSKMLEEDGAVGLNASTSSDQTMYFYSLPSNRLEFWARLEGDRLTQPVLREFYTERDVVIEERRLGESRPQGRLFYSFINAAFQAHPYGIGTIGFPSDLQKIDRRDALAFFDQHYVGGNITIAVVGDVEFAEVKRLADTYFSGVKKGPKPPPVRTVEPEHIAEIRIVLEEDTQPVVLMGHHIPSVSHPDWPAYELLGDLLGSGRASRLYQRLVKTDKIASQTWAGAGFPGDKYPNLLALQAVVAKDATPAQVEEAIQEELTRMIEEGPTQEEVDRVRAGSKSAFIRGLRSNGGLAGSLAGYEEQRNDYRLLFRYLENLEKVTPADIQRVAARTLERRNRVVGIIQKPTS